MNILKLSFKNLLNKPLDTLTSILLFTMGVALISLIFQMNEQLQNQLDRNIKGVDMVVGAKGSPLQLILSSIFHVDVPTGNISYTEAMGLRKNRYVKKVIPLSYGDSYKGYRIIGSVHEYTKLYEAKLKDGKLWSSSDEVTIGSKVASELNLDIGSEFHGAHGLNVTSEDHSEVTYKVVGILEPTNTVLDQLILTSTESIWKVHHNEDTTKREITALLIKFRSPMGMVRFPRYVNANTNMQSAVPAFEITRLINLLGNIFSIMEIVAYVIIGISGLSLFISLLNSFKDRKGELAILRSYGASRGQLFQLTIQEGIILCISGYVLGIFTSRIILLIISTYTNNSYHYQITADSLIYEEILLLCGVFTIGVLASLIPSIRAYRLNIPETLAKS